jgi:plastocyanin
MTSVDKAAIAWSIAIVAVGVAIAGAGSSIDSSPPSAAPAMQEKTSGDPFADIAKETMSKSQEAVREQAMAEQKSGEVSVTAPKVVDVPKMTEPKSVRVSMPSGTSVPGCEETNACFIPATSSIAVGGIVTWSNDDTAAHTVTSGSPTGGPDGVFDSSLVMAGALFEVTFDDAGSIDYFCMVHPWMTGTVNVS